MAGTEDPVLDRAPNMALCCPGALGWKALGWISVPSKAKKEKTFPDPSEIIFFFK